MDAREVIRHFLQGTDLSCDDLITALEWHGNRIIHNGENHGPTLERCAEVADVIADQYDSVSLRTTAENAIFAYRNAERAAMSIAADIRAMGEKIE